MSVFIGTVGVMGPTSVRSIGSAGGSGTSVAVAVGACVGVTVGGSGVGAVVAGASAQAAKDHAARINVSIKRFGFIVRNISVPVEAMQPVFVTLFTTRWSNQSFKDYNSPRLIST